MSVMSDVYTRMKQQLNSGVGHTVMVHAVADSGKMLTLISGPCSDALKEYAHSMPDMKQGWWMSYQKSCLREESSV